jgi:hypothetical protein
VVREMQPAAGGMELMKESSAVEWSEVKLLRKKLFGMAVKFGGLEEEEEAAGSELGGGVVNTEPEPEPEREKEPLPEEEPEAEPEAGGGGRNIVPKHLLTQKIKFFFAKTCCEPETLNPKP